MNVRKMEWVHLIHSCLQEHLCIKEAVLKVSMCVHVHLQAMFDNFKPRLCLHSLAAASAQKSEEQRSEEQMETSALFVGGTLLNAEIGRMLL